MLIPAFFLSCVVAIGSVTTALVSTENSGLAVGALHERTCDTVVILHDETENPVDMVKVVEGWLLICAIPIPDDWKPLARFGQVGADRQSGGTLIRRSNTYRSGRRGATGFSRT